MKNEYDVAVVGLGTAGAIALISAARLGLSVIGIERLSGMGGTGTLGMVRGYYFGSRGGIYEKINQSAKELEETSNSSPTILTKLYALERAALEAGAEFVYDTVVCGVLAEKKCAKGLILLSNGKKHEIRTKYIIDCTGDAYVLKMFGCALRCGREFDGATQPFSNMLVVFDNGKIKATNKDAGYVNQYDADEYSNAVLKSISSADTVKYKSIVTSATILGIREGGTIIGEDNITLEDVFTGKTYEKPLFFAYSNLDNHGKNTAFEDNIIKDWITAAGLWGINFSVPAPLGALIPKGYAGLLAAGRHIAVNHNIAPLVRMKSDMEKCGEAAAAVAFLSIRDNVPAKNVDYDVLVSMLKKTGCHEAKDPLFINRDDLKEFEWPDTPEKVLHEFCYGKPGIGIWGAKQMGESIVNHLEKWLLQDGDAGDYSAFALALLGKAEALPRLRQIAGRLDLTIPKTSIKYVYTKGISAIFLLGRLGDRESIDMLFDIVQNRGAFDETKFISDELFSEPADMRFQHFSYALAALLDICEKCPLEKEKITAFLNENVLQREEVMPVSLKSAPDNKIDMFKTAKNYVQWRLGQLKLNRDI